MVEGAVAELSAAAPEEDSAPPCSCDCCIAQAARTVSAGGACIPRVEGAAEVAGASSGCSKVCGVLDAQRALFDARTAQVDYSRYCPSFCVSLGSDDWGQQTPQAEAMLCASRASLFVAPGRRPLGLLAGRGGEPAPAPAPAPAASLKVAEVSDSILSLAKGEMMTARRHAAAAGMSARAARQAYEDVLAAAQKMGQEVGQGVLKQVQDAAAQQATEALQMRLRWEDAQRSKANKAAAAAVAMYQQAQQRDANIETSWRQRADEFAEAQKQEDQRASKAATQAEIYRDGGDPQGADDFTQQAEASLARAKQYGLEAQAAREQAAEIEKTSEVYPEAMQAAAARALYDNLPPDVPAVPMGAPVGPVVR